MQKRWLVHRDFLRRTVSRSLSLFHHFLVLSDLECPHLWAEKKVQTLNCERANIKILRGHLFIFQSFWTKKKLDSNKSGGFVSCFLPWVDWIRRPWWREKNQSGISADKDGCQGEGEGVETDLRLCCAPAEGKKSSFPVGFAAVICVSR